MFIQVEYDPEFFGGDYHDVGEFVYLPADCQDIEAEFEKKTGLPRANIIHYCPDELYNENGDFVS